MANDPDAWPVPPKCEQYASLWYVGEVQRVVQDWNNVFVSSHKQHLLKYFAHVPLGTPQFSDLIRWTSESTSGVPYQHCGVALSNQRDLSHSGPDVGRMSDEQFAIFLDYHQSKRQHFQSGGTGPMSAHQRELRDANPAVFQLAGINNSPLSRMRAAYGQYHILRPLKKEYLSTPEGWQAPVCTVPVKQSFPPTAWPAR